MNFELSEELVALRDIARDLLSQRWQSEQARKALDAGPARLPEALWAEMAEMGWVGAACGEEFGGSNLGIIAAALLAEEAGRALLPGALMSTLAGAIAIDRCPNEGLKANILPGIIAGKTPLTLAFEEANGTWGPDSIEMAAANEDGFLSLSGAKILVFDATSAHHFLSTVRVDGKLLVVSVAADAPGISLTPMQRIDGQDLAEVRYDQVKVSLDCILDDLKAGSIFAQDAYAVWTVLVAADLLGTAEAVLAMTTAYCKERVQFGRPIGTFQAVSHRLADIQVNIEIGRSLMYGACLALEERRPDAYALVSAAKASLSETAVGAAEAAMQLHGGIGYTWELDVHLHLRRARANALTAGDAVFHREAVACHLAQCYG